MNVGELFVNLGVKGTEKTVSALTSVRSSLSDMTSISLEAKAGLVGAFYAFEQLMSASGKAGTGLANFEALTGMSAQNLQKFQYAARQAGVSAESMTGSLKGVQNVMTNMLAGKGHPEGLGLVNQMVGFDQSKANNALYVFGKLTEFAKATNNSKLAGIGDMVLRSFGVNDDTISAMRRDKFRADIMNRAPTYSEGQIKALDRANVAWSNLGVKIEMAFGKFNAAHGGQLVSDIARLTDQVLKLADSFIKLSDSAKALEWIGQIFKGWSLIFDTINKSMSGEFNDFLFGKAFDQNKFKNKIPDHITPKAPSHSYEHFNNTINQYMNFQHDGKDHQKAAESIHGATQKAIRQNPAQTGGY